MLNVIPEMDIATINSERPLGLTTGVWMSYLMLISMLSKQSTMSLKKFQILTISTDFYNL